MPMLGGSGGARALSGVAGRVRGQAGGLRASAAAEPALEMGTWSAALDPTRP